MFTKNLLIILGIIFAIGCGGSESQNGSETEYIQRIQNWRKKRAERLTKKDGWLSLAGLYWLREGQNSFGSNPSNDIIFPEKAPAFIGTFILQKGSVQVRIRDGIKVLHEGKPVTSLRLQNDVDGNPTILTLGTLSWYIIKRDDAFGVRLRDSENPAIKSFKGIEYYPIDPNWRIEATFEKYDPPKELRIPTILGTVTHESSPGALVFEIEGKTYRLDAISEPGDEEYFIIFADSTNGVETYGAGRYLYVQKPDQKGKVIIDFNKAYNPPCAFTDYATCPFPSEQNHLPVRVNAGEKAYHHLRH